MTRDQGETCMRLEAEGLIGVKMPWHVKKTPISGLILFCDHGHSKLLMIQPDGSTVDLLEIRRLAQDLVRNWHKSMPSSIPGFVGDFGRLASLAIALNGTPPLPDSIDPAGVLKEDGT